MELWLNDRIEGQTSSLKVLKVLSLGKERLSRDSGSSYGESWQGSRS